MGGEIAAGLIASRFVHYLALSVLFGAALFPSYGVAAAQSDPYRRVTWLRALLLGTALFTFASGLSWLGFTAATVSGQLSSATDAASVVALIRETDFGTVWLFRLLLTAGLVLLLLGRAGANWRLQAVLAGSSVLLASIALTGNAGNNAGELGFQHRLADAVHLVASGAWIGALVIFSGLAIVASRRHYEDLQGLHHALSRFAGVGSVAVASLTLSGMFNPGFFLASLDSAYGQVLLAKLVIFGIMLMLAAANRFWLTPKLSGFLAGTHHTARNLKTAVWALQVSVLTETALAIIVLATVAVLGAVTPPDFR